jgi:hypothetical protein
MNQLKYLHLTLPKDYLKLINFLKYFTFNLNLKNNIFKNFGNYE